MDKVHVYLCSDLVLIKSTAGSKNRLFSSPLHISTSSRLTLAEAFRNDNVAACSTALGSATEENESGGYLTVPCPPIVAQRIGLNSSGVTRLVTTKHIRNKYSLLKSRSVIIAANLLTLSIFIQITTQDN